MSHKRQNGWTDRAKFFYGNSHDPSEIEIKFFCLEEMSTLMVFENPQFEQILLFIGILNTIKKTTEINSQKLAMYIWY